MEAKTKRLYFLDAMRAWAILMMLQGHFIDGLLDPVFRDPSNMAYTIWLYFRGITAPVFFTVSGFVFTYLLLKAPTAGLQNPRVLKGAKRGLQLLLIAYALRLNLFGLLQGEIYSGFYLVDVLHCIGVSLLIIIGLYLLLHQRQKWLFALVLCGITMVLFMLEPLYKTWSFSALPMGLANYFTKANGSVFTIIPWLGYATIGAACSLLFVRYKTSKWLLSVAIATALSLGLALILGSSPLFLVLQDITGWSLFGQIQANNYLFIRLGDVFVVFAIFMLLQRYLKQQLVLTIGANTLAIYVIHFIILYGSFTGLGLYKFLHHGLNPWFAIFGAACFMFACTFLALRYQANEALLGQRKEAFVRQAKLQGLLFWRKNVPLAKFWMSRLWGFLLRFLTFAKIRG